MLTARTWPPLFQNCPQVSCWLTWQSAQLPNWKLSSFCFAQTFLTFSRVMGVLTRADSGTLILYSSFSKTGWWSFMSPSRTCNCL